MAKTQQSNNSAFGLLPRIVIGHGIGKLAVIALTVLGVGSLAGCGNQWLDIDRIEAGIQQEIEARGGVPVKEVFCPNPVAIAPGETFECDGELSQGGFFKVTVRQEDELGNVSWEIPNSRSLLNLEELERHFQAELAVETESFPLVDCGGVYRLNQPGSSFECQVSNAIARDQSRIEAIEVQIDTRGDVSWQQIRQQTVATATVGNPATATGNNPATTTGATPAASPTPAPSPEEGPSEEGTGANAGPPAASAEEFLNRPGAMDGF
jgi:hypothetical protein